MQAKIIAVCANRTQPLSTNAQCLVTDLSGSTLGIGKVCTLPTRNLGKFWTPEWKHVSGVVILDYLRGTDESLVDHFLYRAPAEPERRSNRVGIVVPTCSRLGIGGASLPVGSRGAR